MSSAMESLISESFLFYLCLCLILLIYRFPSSEKVFFFGLENSFPFNAGEIEKAATVEDHLYRENEYVWEKVISIFGTREVTRAKVKTQTLIHPLCIPILCMCSAALCIIKQNYVKYMNVTGTPTIYYKMLRC